MVGGASAAGAGGVAIGRRIVIARALARRRRRKGWRWRAGGIRRHCNAKHAPVAGGARGRGLLKQKYDSASAIPSNRPGGLVVKLFSDVVVFLKKPRVSCCVRRLPRRTCSDGQPMQRREAGGPFFEQHNRVRDAPAGAAAALATARVRGDPLRLGVIPRSLNGNRVSASGGIRIAGKPAAVRGVRGDERERRRRRLAPPGDCCRERKPGG